MTQDEFDHVQFYRDGRHYDLQHDRLRHDIDFYLELGRRYGDPVLELACGTGRLTVPLAEAGHDITGIDISDGMLQQARQNVRAMNKAPRFVKADIRDFKLDQLFRLIFFPFNSIAHLHERSDVECCFACAKRHLDTDGRFMIAFFNPSVALLARPSDQVREVVRYPDPDTQREVIISESARYDAARQINYVSWNYDVEGQYFSHSLNMRIYFPQELQSLLHYNGFVVEQVYGDFDQSPFTSESPHQLIVARVK